MSISVRKRKRGVHDRVKRKVILVVTENNILSEDDIYSEYHLDRGETAVRIVRTELKGKSLERAIKRYMREHQICTAQGDQVIRINKNCEGG